ncbi:MAG: TauD/TfdA family dioxygenase, partial [Rhodospirillaceae bacterium]
TMATGPLWNAEFRRIDVTPVAGALGAEIAGVDLNALDDEQVAEVRAALLKYAVVFFRDQDLTPDGQTAFARRFGPLNRHPYVTPMDGHPDVFRITKEPEDKHHFGNSWHTDLAYTETPALGTVLYGVEVPAAGGDTLFASQTAAFEALSDGMKAMLGGMKVVYTNANSYGKGSARFRDGVAKAMDVRQAEGREVVHPVVRTHPETGRKGLYLSATHFARFDAMTAEESRPLFDYLVDHATRPQHLCRFRWQNGSVAMWDNRCTMHYAISDFPNDRRIMQRVTLEGDAPF